MDAQQDIHAEVAELRAQLQQVAKVTKENNYILHRMQFWGRVAFGAKVLVWALVLISPILIYSYFAPFINVLPGGAGGQTNASSTSLFGFPSPTELIKSIK